MTPATFTGFGTENVVTSVELAILDMYDDMLIAIDQRQAPWDEARATARGEEYVPITTPAVSAENIHPGALPSFIQTADQYRFYPLIAIVPDTIAKNPEDLRADQLTVFNNGVTIHVMSRTDVSIPDDDAIASQTGQSIVERRVTRMAEAMFLLFKTHSSMRRMFGQDPAPVIGRIAEPWKFPVEDRRGEDFMFCSLGMEFQIRNYSPPEEV